MPEGNFALQLAEVEFSIRSLFEWSLGFEGDRLCVLVDELQFLLHAQYVTVRMGSAERKNVLDFEAAEIGRHALASGRRETIESADGVSITVTDFTVLADISTVFSRRSLKDVSKLYVYTWGEGDIEIRLGFSAMTESLRATLVGGHFRSWLRGLVARVAAYSDKGNGLDLGDFRIDTVHNRFRQSRYLEAALGWMHKKIVEVIGGMGPAFAADADSPFFCELFPKCHGLRSVAAQAAILSATRTVGDSAQQRCAVGGRG